MNMNVSRKRKKTSTAYARLILFLKNTKPNGVHEWEFAGTQQEAEAFIQSMRVNLSRLRIQAKEHGISLPEFKMILHSIEQVREGVHMIKLVKQVGTPVSNPEEVREIMEIFGGENGD